MIQAPNYADEATTANITGWAQARYQAEPSYYTRENGYDSGPLTQPAVVSQPSQPSQPNPTSTAKPTSAWASAVSAPAVPSAPAITQAPTTAAPTPTAAPSYTTPASGPIAPVKVGTIDPASLANRTVDAATETVQGRMSGLMDENSQYMQQARADAMRSANERGMLNSAMAASGGTDAAIRSALPIATSDAATYAGAADYNTALKNQTTMWNADQTNQGNKLDAQYQNEAAARAQALNLAQMQDQTTRWQEANRLASSQWEAQMASDTARWQETNRLQQAQWEKQVSDATTRYTAEMQDATSRYNTDASYRRQSDETRLSMANNIVQNMDLSPDRKAAMLEALGQGTMARYVNGVYQPGTGLAGAVYVLGSVSDDLNFSGADTSSSAPGVFGIDPSVTTGSAGKINGVVNQAVSQAQAQQQQAARAQWGSGRMTNSAR